MLSYQARCAGDLCLKQHQFQHVNIEFETGALLAEKVVWPASVCSCGSPSSAGLGWFRLSDASEPWFLAGFPGSGPFPPPCWAWRLDHLAWASSKMHEVFVKGTEWTVCAVFTLMRVKLPNHPALMIVTRRRGAVTGTFAGVYSSTHMRR